MGSTADPWDVVSSILSCGSQESEGQVCSYLEASDGSTDSRPAGFLSREINAPERGGPSAEAGKQEQKVLLGSHEGTRAKATVRVLRKSMPCFLRA